MEEKYYEILRHYVNPNDCATVVKQLLSLHNVSQKREVLLAYEEFTSYKVLGKKTPRISKQMVEDYLANNCG